MFSYIFICTDLSRTLKEFPMEISAFDDFKNKQKRTSSNAFFLYVKVCIFWKRTQYTVHWDKTQMSKKFPSDKINGTKNALFFLLRAPAHHSFTLNLRVLYELEYKVRLSKTLCGIFHFQFRFVFIKVFFQQNAWIFWLWNVLIPLKIKIIEKPHAVLLPDLWF